MHISREFICKFLLGGNCECIIENLHTGNRFKYRILKSTSSRAPLYFIYVDQGSLDYVGYIRVSNNNTIAFETGKKGKLSTNNIMIKALLFVLHNSDRLPTNVQVSHVGKCGRCGRSLTTKESLERGIGPECLKKL